MDCFLVVVVIFVFVWLVLIWVFLVWFVLWGFCWFGFCLGLFVCLFLVFVCFKFVFIFWWVFFPFFFKWEVHLKIKKSLRLCPRSLVLGKDDLSIHLSMKTRLCFSLFVSVVPGEKTQPYLSMDGDAHIGQGKDFRSEGQTCGWGCIYCHGEHPKSWDVWIDAWEVFFLSPLVMSTRQFSMAVAEWCIVSGVAHFGDKKSGCVGCHGA